MRRWLFDLDHRVFLKTIVFSVLLGVLWWNQHSGFIARQRETCEALNKANGALVTYIDEQLDRAETTLPTLTYYKQHPDELQQQLQLIRKQRRDTHKAFPQVGC